MGDGLTVSLALLALVWAPLSARAQQLGASGPDAREPVATENTLAEASNGASLTRWTGRVVVQRALVAPDGGLPDESLEPLLRIRPDVPFTPMDVRDDIAMLHRVLDVARVEVDVEEWPGFDADGQPFLGVKVEYRVWPPPRVDRVRFAGNRVLSDRALRAASGVEVGAPFFADDAVALERAVRGAYLREGYPRAEVVVTATPDAERRLRVDVTVDEGTPQRLTEIAVRDGGALPAARVREILAHAGLAKGRAWTESAVSPARDAVLAALRTSGWWSARVSMRVEPALSMGELGADPPERATSDRLVVIVDPRERWRLRVDGHGLPSARDVRAMLGVLDGTPVGADLARAAEEAVRAHLSDAGWPAPKVHAEVVTPRGAPSAHQPQKELCVSGDAGSRHRLRDVTFEGDTVFGAAYLEDALREASPDLLGRGRVSPRAIDDALVLVQEFFRAQGYLSAGLTRIGFVEGNGRGTVPVDVAVRVEPGPRAVLRNATVRTSDGDALPDDIDAAARFADMVGQPYNPATADARARQLVEDLAERGHLEADARPRATVSPDGTAVDLVVDVAAGPVVYLRTVVLRGYRRTRRAVIAREVDVRPGDPLAPSRLGDMRRRLYELDTFRRVDLQVEGDEDRVKDLVVRVEEKPNLHFEAGGGLATDQGARVFARAGHRNLFGLGHRVTALGQVGLGWLGDGWTLDVVQPEWRAAARYEAPNIPGRGERVALDVLFNEREQEPTFRMERTGAAASARLRFGAFGSAELAYRVQARRLMDVDPGVFVPGDPWLDEMGIATLGDDPHPETPSDLRTQSGVEVSALYDRRDDPFNPARGALGSMVITLTDRLLSDTVFLKADGAWTQWVPAGPVGLQLRARGGVGWVPSAEGTLPLEERFRLGGGTTLRGYDLDTVGPANAVSRERVDWPDALDPLVEYSGRDAGLRWVPTGGDALALLSAEVRLPMERLGLASLTGTQLAAFTDVGNVWFVTPGVTADSAATDPLLRWSVGLGVRRTTAIGPVEVDVGFNPARIPERDEELVRLHVSLGAQ